MGDLRDEVDVRGLFLGGLQRYGRLVHQIADDRWTDPTPCTEWDVRALVHHLVGENVWVPPLLQGMTIAEVGDRFSGDLLGEDPVGAWDRSQREADSAARDADVGATVHVSYGDIPARHYLFEVANDLWIHGWDLARAIGADETMERYAVDAFLGYYGPQEAMLKASGAFGPIIETAPEADPQTRLLAVFGRVA
jgi:uncharacterized protein (TIGR03086 family)